MKPIAAASFFVHCKISCTHLCSVDNVFEWNEKLNNVNYAYRPYAEYERKQIMNEKKQHILARKKCIKKTNWASKLWKNEHIV